MLEQYTTLAIFHFFIVFCRVGSAMMFMPGFGEIYVNTRTRLSIALAISFIMTPAIDATLPLVPNTTIELFMVILPEIIVGLFIGGTARMIQSALHIGGMIIAFQSSLASALLFDANQGSQGSVIGIFLTLIGVTLMFVTNLHYLLIEGIADSYLLFSAGTFPPVNDFAEFASTTLSKIFLISMKIASPLIITGLCLYLIAGIMGRLMPNMQVFFVIIPLQLYVSFVMIALTFSAGMMIYLRFFEDTISTLVGIV